MTWMGVGRLEGVDIYIGPSTATSTTVVLPLCLGLGSSCRAAYTEWNYSKH
jgi:hypothetical protein